MDTLTSSRLPAFFHHKNSSYTEACAVIYHLLQLFIQDTKDLVRNTVHRNIKAQRQSNDPLTHAHGTARQAALKAWLSMNNPLSYGDGQDSTITGYRQLLIILDEDPRNPITQLKYGTQQFTHQDLGMLFYTQGIRAPRTNTPPPFTRHGACLPALPLGLTRIKRNSGLGEESKDTIAALFTRMVRKMEIHIVPWHKSENEHTRATATRGDWWMKIKHSGSSQAPKNQNLDREQDHQDLVQHALDRNVDAPWTLPSELKDMGPLWNKATLPSQWGLEHASLPITYPGHENHYMLETYNYVCDGYDGKIWWHHMGLVWAVMFSKTAPFLCITKGVNIQSTESTSRMTQEVQRLSWVKPTSKTHRGMTSPTPFITMMSTTIISLLDASSPLRRRMTRHNNSMGAVWTKKHGILIIIIIIAHCLWNT
jgi:hypothetical protein